MTWETWLLYAATDAFAYLVPGPAALFIVSQALARGAGRTSWAILGVLSAEAMYFVLSATGLALLLLFVRGTSGPNRFGADPLQDLSTVF